MNILTLINSIHIWVASIRRSLANKGPLRVRLTYGVFWSLAGTAIPYSLNIVISIITARLLGTGGFGKLSILNTTFGVLGIFSGLGLGVTATKYIAEWREKNPELAGEVLGFLVMVTTLSSGIFFLLLWVLAPLLAAQVLKAPHLVDELRIGCFLLVFNGLNGVEISVLGGFEAFKTIAWVITARAIISFPIIAVGIWKFGLRGAVWGMVLVAAFGWLLSYIARRRVCQQKGIVVCYRNVRPGWKILWGFSLPALISSVLAGPVTPVTWLVNTMVLGQPNGYNEVGVFNAAYQWRHIVLFFPNILAQTIMPILSSLFGAQEHQSAKKVLVVTVAATTITSLPIIVMLILLRNEILQLYGPGFSGHGLILTIVVIMVGLVAVQTPANQMFAASGHMAVALAINIVGALVLLISSWVLIEQFKWGALGLATSYLLAQIVQTIGTFWFGARVLKNWTGGLDAF